MTLRFSDGVEFDTSGPLRLTARQDGWYVVGMGMLVPVDTREEGLACIRDMQRRQAVSNVLHPKVRP